MDYEDAGEAGFEALVEGDDHATARDGEAGCETDGWLGGYRWEKG